MVPSDGTEVRSEKYVEIDCLIFNLYLTEGRYRTYSGEFKISIIFLVRKNIWGSTYFHDKLISKEITNIGLFPYRLFADK